MQNEIHCCKAAALLVRNISCNCLEIVSSFILILPRISFVFFSWSKSGFCGCVHWTFRAFRVAESVSACCCSCFCGGFKWIIHVVMSNRRKAGRFEFEAANEIAFCQRSSSRTQRKIVLNIRFLYWKFTKFMLYCMLAIITSKKIYIKINTFLNIQ